MHPKLSKGENDMLKKNIKIIKGTLRPEKEKLAKVVYHGGFYYACDDFRMVRFEELPDELPLFEDNEPRFDVEFGVLRAAEQTYREFVVPYPIEVLKKWRTGKRKEPYRLGISGKTSYGSEHWFGININFLIDAIETTGSYVIKVPERYTAMVMEGNGFTWMIMPIDVKDGKDKGETIIV